MSEQAMRDAPEKLPRHRRGQPLFAQNMQPILVVFYGLAAAMLGSFAGGILCTATSRYVLLNLGALPFFGMACFFWSVFRRTHAVYGSPEGIEIVWFGQARTYPWPQVGQLDVEPAYMSYPTRIVHLTLLSDPEKNIRFFAMDSDVKAFEAMRAASVTSQTKNDA